METGLVIIGLLYVGLSLWTILNLFSGMRRTRRTRG
jgi:hypothetical protein